MSNRNDEFIVCACGEDALHLSADPADEPHPYIYATWWKSGDRDPQTPWPWKMRLEHAWRWLRGRPTFAYSVCLEIDQAEELGRALLRKAQEFDTEHG